MIGELKPCPFCGEYLPQFVFSYNPYTMKREETCYLQCMFCGCRTKVCNNRALATDAWNRRASDEQIH